MNTLPHRFIQITATACAVFTLAGTAQAADLRSWDQKIDQASKRFVVLAAFNNEAVLDKETQLVWERAPSATDLRFANARDRCLDLTVGGRLGWRLPSAEELRSLIDTQVTDPALPALPAGHPFHGIRVSYLETGMYWTTTKQFQSDLHRYAGAIHKLSDRSVWGLVSSSMHSAWCVRGGSSAPE